MFTVCPKCALTLVVTAADLRVAQGYVRCGRCSSVFNALARLTDERQSSAADSEPETAPPPVESPVAATEPAAAAARAPPRHTPAPADSVTAPAGEEAIPEDALEFDPATTDLGSVFVEPPPDPQWTAATGSFRAMIAAGEPAPADTGPAQEESPEAQLNAEVDDAFLSSMLHSDEPNTPREPTTPAPARQRVPPPSPTAQSQPPQPPPAERQPLESGQRAPLKRAAEADAAAAARTTGTGERTGVPHAKPHIRPGFEAASRPSPTAQRRRTTEQPRVAAAPRAEQLAAAGPPPLAPDDDQALAGAAGTAPVRPQAWRIGSAFAALLLLAQILNHYRDELAANARFNRPLTALYSALGVRLVPHWDLHAYDVRQLGASVDPAGAGLITVRASIKNAAQQAQPLPLLRVTLQDRFGNRIASSDVAPGSYLPQTVPASSFLAAGQRIDAEMGFVDPGTNAVGFEIDACLPVSSGAVACANDASAR